jgi:CRISPR-associated protein Cas1
LKRKSCAGYPLNARDRVQWLYRQGYRWFFKAHVEDFFDTVSHELLEIRLRSLLPDDPVIELLLAWVSAPVQFRGERIERPMGLPQGSPVSPLLANLMLDDFDSDLETLGMALVRFADDFIVVCKSREEAEAAAARAEASLAELGLAVNPRGSAFTIKLR